MKTKMWPVCIMLPLLAAGPANAQIIKGVMAIKGAEMSWWGGMARDAISRQYDVEKNLMTLTCEGDKGSYRPGLITFYAKKGKSLDLDNIRESITATRLSGGTRMSVTYLEITALGDVVLGGKDNVLNVSGTGQQFVLGEDPSAKGILQKLGEATRRGDKIASVTGRVEGWNGAFPNVLRALAKSSNQDRTQLLVTGFEVAKK